MSRNRVVMRYWCVVALILGVYGIDVPLLGQTNVPPQPSPNESSRRRPGQSYQEAMRPLDIVRNSLDNWSDAELSALAAGMHEAKEACSQAEPEDYSGDDLYDLERLCALGQDWSATNLAAARYLAGGSEMHRAHSYAMSIDALIHIDDIAHAVKTARDMLHELPYDPVVAQSFWYLTTYLERSFDKQALELASEQQASLITALSKGGPLKDTHGEAAMSIGTLYEIGLHLAFLQRYAGKEHDAEYTIHQLKAALSGLTSIDSESQKIIDSGNTRYSLLGKHLPSVNVSRSFLSVAAKARFNRDLGSSTVLLMFPDSCGQCRRMLKTLNAFNANEAEARIHAYGLITETQPDAPSEPSREARLKDLEGTPTLIVPSASSDAFGAKDFPFAVVTDQSGRVQYIGVIPTNAFDRDSYMHHIVQRISNASSSTAKQPISEQ
ncbi:MAG TPA: hypothetical protein VK638_22725 [Edaphobacter sp.]|nr:hypothetical protein [Edaphobacter sp.]